MVVDHELATLTSATKGSSGLVLRNVASRMIASGSGAALGSWGTMRGRDNPLFAWTHGV